MPDISQFLQEEAALHPKMEVQDAVKFIYQGVFGCGHMVNDISAAVSRLRTEYESVEPSDSLPDFQMLSESWARVNISAVKGRISPETLGRIFVLSAREPKGGADDFEKNLGLLCQYFSKGDIDAYLQKYKKDGYPPVSHTGAYRSAYNPAYRVVSAKFIPLLPVFAAIDSKNPHIVGIDGRCGGGKTTYADLLSLVYPCNVFRADDYFLPLEMRTPERLSSPGGNMHRERLLKEILIPLGKGGDVTYRRFNCSDFTYSQPIHVKYCPLNIIEGSYCLHPDLERFYDLRIFADIDPETQIERIEKRNGKELAKKFSAVWIPLEEKYFKEYSVKSKCDIVVS